MHKTLDPQTILIPAYTAATKSRVRCIPSSSIIIPHPDFPSVSENKQESFRNILIFTQDNWSSEKLHPMTINDHQWSSVIIIDHHWSSSFIIIIIHHSSFIIHHSSSSSSSFIIHHSPSSSPSYSYSSWIIIITTLGFFSQLFASPEVSNFHVAQDYARRGCQSPFGGLGLVMSDGLPPWDTKNDKQQILSNMENVIRLHHIWFRFWWWILMHVDGYWWMLMDDIMILKTLKLIEIRKALFLTFLWPVLPRRLDDVWSLTD